MDNYNNDSVMTITNDLYTREGNRASLLGKSNVDDDEYIFSWINDDPMLRPGTMKCKNCNYQVNNDNVQNNEVVCKNCGYRIKMYGFPMTMYSGYYDVDQPSDRINEDAYTAIIRGDPSQSSGVGQIEQESPSPIMAVEHMTDTDDNSAMANYVIMRLLLFVIVLMIANLRNELTLSSGLCIFLFPELYFGYVLVDIFVFNNHYSGCIAGSNQPNVTNQITVSK